jgi:hypothetical protein
VSLRSSCRGIVREMVGKLEQYYREVPKESACLGKDQSFTGGGRDHLFAGGPDSDVKSGIKAVARRSIRNREIPTDRCRVYPY